MKVVKSLELTGTVWDSDILQLRLIFSLHIHGVPGPVLGSTSSQMTESILQTQKGRTRPGGCAGSDDI